MTARNGHLAAGADTLTALRLITGVALLPFAWQGSWPVVAVLLSSAWLGDVLDGRLARRSSSETVLGSWDLRADTAVGAGLLVGLAGHGTVPWLLALAALAVFGGLFIAGNVAASMLLQLAGYLPFLHVAWTERPAAWWLPFATIVFVGIVNWRRLVYVAIPAFLRGVAGRFEHR